MKLLTSEQQEPYEIAKIFVNKSLKISMPQIKSIIKLEIIVISQVNIEVPHLVNVI